MSAETYSWPYANEIGDEETVTSDVLVLGGGLAGCFAAIAAARKGKSVVLVEKGAVERSGSAGTGFDHWESACTNPCSGVTPEEIDPQPLFYVLFCSYFLLFPFCFIFSIITILSIFVKKAFFVFFHEM